MKKRLQAFFSGAVQGVGFRYTAEHAARKFPVTGYVKNLPNGQVELLAEGEEGTVREFLAEIRGAFKDSVRDVDSKWSEARSEFEGFGVRF